MAWKVNETNPSNPLKDEIVSISVGPLNVFQNGGTSMVRLQGSQRNVSE